MKKRQEKERRFLKRKKFLGRRRKRAANIDFIAKAKEIIDDIFKRF